MSGRPNKPGPKSAAKRGIERQLDAVRRTLTELQDKDGETGQYSVEHCSAMAKFWGAHFLRAEEEWRTTDNTEIRKLALNEMVQASREAGEWEKRKSTAIAGKKADLLEKVLARLDEQDQLANELLDVEE
jgi:hypothetical protein